MWVESGRRLEHDELDGPADRGSDGQQRAGLLAESRATRADRVAHALGDVRAGRVGVVAQELLREQRVAAAAVEDRCGQRRIRVIAEPGARQGGDVVVREATERDLLHDAVAAHVRQRAAEAVSRPSGRRAGGRDDEELGGP